MRRKKEKTYFCQKFLLNTTDYETFNVVIVRDENIEFLQEYGTRLNLLDYHGGDSPQYVRRLNLGTLDAMVDTEDDWNRFAADAAALDQLILTADFEAYVNPILRQYRFATLKAYLTRLHNAGVLCRVVNVF